MRFQLRQPTDNQVLEELIPIRRDVSTLLEKLDDTYTAALNLEIESDRATRDQLDLAWKALEQALIQIERTCKLAGQR